METPDYLARVNPGLNLAGLRAPFPPHEIKKKGQYPYIPGVAIVRRLNDCAGEWSNTILREYDAEIERRKDGIVTKIPVKCAIVCVTIVGLGSREHKGVQVAEANAGEDSTLKGAITDGIKKAAELFGIGLLTCDGDEQSGGRAATGGKCSEPGCTNTLNDSQARVSMQKHNRLICLSCQSAGNRRR